MTKPLIGLTGRRKLYGDVRHSPPAQEKLDAYWFFADYARGVSEAGGVPVHLGLDADPQDYVETLDGILLTGGADIHPMAYGAEAETDAFPPEPDRDQFELALMAAAAQAAIPVLGICRGLQLINVFAGGTLHQDVPPHGAFDQPVDTLVHTVLTEPGSTVARLYGSQCQVNSLHHQTVDRLGAGLAVSGRAEDGTIEAVEHSSLPVVAVQWHPEMLPTRPTDPVFGWLVAEAAQYRQ